MSSAKISIIPAGALFDGRMKPHHIRVLAIISAYGAVKENGCWPSYNRLCEDVGVTRRVLIDYIKHICECGWLEKLPRNRGDGSTTSNRYKINIELTIDVSGKPTSSLLSAAPQHQAALPDNTPSGAAPQLPLDMNNKSKNDIKTLKGKKHRAETMTLEQWEEKNGLLGLAHLENWLKDARVDARLLPPLIEEFRLKVQAKGFLYADFKAAFLNYLRSGWLSKPLDAVRSRGLREASSEVVIHDTRQPL